MQRSTRFRIAAVVATMALVVTTALPAFAATTLHIDGSTTLFPLASKWAQVYKASSGWAITVAGGGSGKGITDAHSGVVDIGMSSRMKQSSDPANEVFTPVARDALTIVINGGLYKKYPKYMYKMTTQQVQDVFRGKITNWHQLNSKLPSHAIDLVGRTGSSGTYTYFKQMFLTNQSTVGLIGTTMYKQSARTRTYASNGIVRSTVGGDMWSIGYLSEAYVNSSVHALNLPAPANYYDMNYVAHPMPASLVGHYVVPTLANSKNGTWAYVRPLYFVTEGNPTGNAATFINWCANAGQAFCASQHYLTLH